MEHISEAFTCGACDMNDELRMRALTAKFLQVVYVASQRQLGSHAGDPLWWSIYNIPNQQQLTLIFLTSNSYSNGRQLLWNQGEGWSRERNAFDTWLERWPKRASRISNPCTCLLEIGQTSTQGIHNSQYQYLRSTHLLNMSSSPPSYLPSNTSLQHTLSLGISRAVFRVLATVHGPTGRIQQTNDQIPRLDLALFEHLWISGLRSGIVATTSGRPNEIVIWCEKKQTRSRVSTKTCCYMMCHVIT